ncbi:MAG: transcription antitermination factor NusB [Cyanobacteriota bacterium]|nr:transcription antitermination factor NusB [Cyanobacteriota bacterium]
MQSRSVSRELALLLLAQLPDRGSTAVPSDTTLLTLLEQALTSLAEHVRDSLERSAGALLQAQQDLLDSELRQGPEAQIPKVRQHLQEGIASAEQALNRLSASLEIPSVLMLADQESVRLGAIDRARAVVRDRDTIDARLDAVMEGWRLTRLPRIDRDILRLAVVDLDRFNTPAAVACNEAVELAKRYSDEQGRRMINGVLGRFTAART